MMNSQTEHDQKITLRKEGKVNMAMKELEMGMVEFIKALRKMNTSKATPDGTSSDDMHALYSDMLKIAADAGIPKSELE